MPATRRSRDDPSVVGTVSVCPTVTPRRSASAAGRIVLPPASMAASAAARSPATNASRPSAAMSAPTTAAASVRVPSRATSNVAIGLTRARFGTAAVISPTTPSSGATGRIDVRTSSPGTTSAIQPAAAARAFWPTPPRATIIASPMVRPPSVSVVRLGSRLTALRASRSSTRSSRANGAPAIRVMTGSRNGMRSVPTRRTA